MLSVLNDRGSSAAKTGLIWKENFIPREEGLEEKAYVAFYTLVASFMRVQEVTADH